MRSSVLTLRKPIPLARAIRWVPAGLFTPPRTLDDLALFITQGALREVMRHLRSDPEQELLGFLLGELYECPETGARYVMVNSAVRTGHAIAESDRILIPEEEWLGVQLEVRRRRTQLIGWYHSAPFVGPHPARADLETHSALFTEPWQCGLVIATSGEAPTGAFFRSLLGERTGGGVLIPFYELPDDDEPIPADGRKRTLIDWVNYETRGTVERDESEPRPFVASRPATPRGTPVILSVPSAPEEELDDEEPATPREAEREAERGLERGPRLGVERAAAHGGAHGGAHGAEREPAREPAREPPRTSRDDSPTVIPLAPHRSERVTDRAGERATEPAAHTAHAGPTVPAGRASERMGERASGPASELGGDGRAEPGGPQRTRPVTPTRSGSGLVMLPSAAELEEMLATPTPPEQGGSGAGRAFRYLLALVVVALVAYLYLWNSGRVQLPGFLAGIPGFDNISAPTSAFGTVDSEITPGSGGASANPAPTASPATSPVAESAGASLSSDSPSVASAAGDSPIATSGTMSPATGIASPTTASSDPAVQRFTTLADSLEATIRNFQDRNDDFAVHRITCDGLAVGYRAADDAFIALASAHRAALESLDSTSEARYRRLVNGMGRVNEEFGASGCPRP